MDGQLAFFRARPARAMGRKGAEPSAVIAARHSSTPSSHGASKGPDCQIPSPRKCGDGESSPWGLCPVVWPWQGRSREGVTVLVAREGEARGSPGLSPPRAGLEPGLVPHCVPKASFQAGGYQGGGKASAGLLKRHIWAGTALWGCSMSPLILRDSTAGVRGGNGVTLPCQPSFPSQQQEWSSDFSPKWCPWAPARSPPVPHRQGWGLCLGLPL